MQRLIQKPHHKAIIPYDRQGFDFLQGNKRFTHSNQPYVNFKLALSDSAQAYFYDEINENTFVNDVLLYTVEVSIYEDKIEIIYPYIPTDEWLEIANKNIIKIIENKTDEFECDLTNCDVNTTDENYTCTHPQFSNFEILKIFNDSLYNFEVTKYKKLDLDWDFELNKNADVYLLKDVLDNKLGVYYIPNSDSFYFDTDKNKDIVEIFNRMVIDVLSIQSPVEYLINSYDEVIDSGSLVPWLYWHGYPAIHFWDYIQDYICLGENESYSREECFNYVKNQSPDTTILHLRRMEAELLELLNYEYPIYDINEKSVIKSFRKETDKNVNKILWEDSFDYLQEIYDYVNRELPNNAFDYNQEVGYVGDIIYYKSNNLPVKIAVQLTRYKSVIPVNNDVRFEKAINITPFGWYAKVIGIKKLDESLESNKIKSEIKPDSYYLLHNSIFDEATQLLYNELDSELDIMFNEPDMNVWD